MKISVITITKDRPEMLKRCLKSFTFQTKIPDEIIIVDSSSDDKTKNLVKSFKKILPIKYLYEQRKGYSIARNTGIKHSKGKIIVFTDDDCVADKDWIRNIEYYHRRYPDVAGIGGKINLPKDSNFFMKIAHLLNKQNFDYLIKKMGFHCIYIINNSYKRKYLESIHGFDEHPYSGDDLDLNWRLFKKDYKLIYIPEIIVEHYQRNTIRALIKQRFEYIKMNYRMGKIHPDYPSHLKAKIFFILLEIIPGLKQEILYPKK